MELGRLLAVTSFFGLAVSAYAQTAHTAPGKYDPKTLAQVQALYGLNEDAAVTRLAKEYEAAEQARRIEDRQLSSYAGSWFDSKTQTLQVAISNGADAAAVQKVGAMPVLVGRNLAELEAVRGSIANELDAELGAGSVRESYVDVQANGLVLGISKSKINQASASRAARAHVDIPVHFQVAADDVEFSSSVWC